MNKLFCVLCGLATVTANLHATPLFSDSFTYPAGNLAGQGPWLQNGTSTVNPIQVSDGRVMMLNTGQDVNAALTSPFSLVDGTSFYIGLTINVSAAQSGDYFLHWSPATGSTIFLSRMQIRSATGGFQLGYVETSGTGASLTWGTDVLSLNQDYRVVLAYNVVAGANNDTANLYVNPVDYAVEANNTPYLSDTWDSVTGETTTMGAINLRQGGATSGATLSVDNLVVGTAFGDMQVIPEPSALALALLGGLALLGLRRRN